RKTQRLQDAVYRFRAPRFGLLVAAPRFGSSFRLLVSAPRFTWPRNDACGFSRPANGCYSDAADAAGLGYWMLALSALFTLSGPPTGSYRPPPAGAGLGYWILPIPAVFTPSAPQRSKFQCKRSKSPIRSSKWTATR